MSQQSSPRDSLGAILSIEDAGALEFSARLEDFWGSALGADAIARAALAAWRTAEGRQLHALHACYLGPLPPGVPLRLRVERLSDTRALARRRVQVLDDDRLLCSVTAGFVVPGEGLSYQGASLEPDLPRPEDLPSTLETATAEGWADYSFGPVEFRRIGAAWPWPPAAAHASTTHREWVRPRQPLPDDPGLRMAALVFLSDFYSHWTASDRLGTGFVPPRFQALDHAVWIHRPEPWKGWWLLEAVSDVGSGGRMFTRRELYSAAGSLIASASQEGLYSG